MELNGLYLGIDISDKISQICYYDVEEKSVKAVFKNGESVEFENSKNLKSIIKHEEKPETVIYSMLNALIKSAKKQSGIDIISSVCICIRDYSLRVRKIFRKALDMLDIPKERTILIGESEAFAYYVFNEEPALYAQGTILYNYGENNITSCYLQRAPYKGMTVLRELDDRYSSPELQSHAAKHGGDLSNELITQLKDFFAKTLQENRASSVYMTGCGFDVDKIPGELLDYFTRKSLRIFAGQNLYVKGACICALALISPIADPIKKAGLSGNIRLPGSSAAGIAKYGSCIMACKNRISTEISLKAYYKGQTFFQNLIMPGDGIDKSSGEFECILTDANVIQFGLKPIGANNTIIENIDLSDIKKRDDRLTRVKIKLEFPDEDTMDVFINDMGFAEEEANDVTIRNTIHITAREYTPEKEIKNKGAIYCEGRRSDTPFVFAETGRNIYTIEELVQYLYRNIYLINDDIINNDFIKFIGEDTGHIPLAEKLKSLISAGANTYKLLITLFREVNYFSSEEVKIIEAVMNSAENTNPVLRKYSVAETYFRNKCYARAQKAFFEIIDAKTDKRLPESFYIKAYHNMGVCLGRMLFYKDAAECFEKAYEMGRDEKEKKAALTARILSGTQPCIMYTEEETQNIKKEIDAAEKQALLNQNGSKVSLNEKIESMKKKYLRSML